MGTFTAPAATDVQPSVSPTESGEIIAVRGFMTIPATLVVTNTISLVKLPVDCVPVDFIIDNDSLAASTLAFSVGFIAGSGAEMRASAVFGSAAGITRMDSLLTSRIAPSATVERNVGLRCTASGITPTAGVVGFTLFYRTSRYGT